jgi:hypothetical protein
MNRRLAFGGAMLAAALLLQVAVVGPMRRRTEAAAAEYASARQQRQSLVSRVATLEKREELRRRAALAFRAPAAEPGGLVRAVRRSVVRSLDETAVRGVRLGVGLGGQPAGADVHVTAQGEFDEALRAAGHVVRPGTGLVLRAVRLSPGPGPGQVGLDLRAFGPGAGP